MKVGIFWRYHKQIIDSAILLKDGVDDGFFVNGHYSHVSFWETVRQKYSELRMFEYEEIPRGRVLFSKEEEMFFVYMDQLLFSQNFKQLILEKFELSEAKVKFMRDAHYTTDKKQIDQLFDDK